VPPCLRNWRPRWSGPAS